MKKKQYSSIAKKKQYKKTPTKKKMRSSSFTVEQGGLLLDTMIAQTPGKTRNILKSVLRERQAQVNGKSITQFDHPLKVGDKVEILWDRIIPQKHPRELKIIFEDDNLIVINKPAGLLTVATDKEKRKTAYSMLSTYVKDENPDNKIFIVHRIDRETSGLLLFARNETVKRQIQETWETTISQRTYVGVVEGDLQPGEGTISSWLKETKAFRSYSSQIPDQGVHAVTHYKKLRSNNTFSLVQLNLETGRKHQIRVHMQDINHPIVGDKKYGSKQSPIRRMGLHARVLAFTHPVTGEECHFETPIPKKFMDLFPAK